MAKITVFQPLVTRTAAGDGPAIDISTLTGGWTLAVEILATGPDTAARFAYIDSNGLASPDFVVPNGINKASSKRLSFSYIDFPGIPFGVAGATLKLSLTRLTGTSGGTITYQAWLEQ